MMGLALAMRNPRTKAAVVILLTLVLFCTLLKFNKKSRLSLNTECYQTLLAMKALKETNRTISSFSVTNQMRVNRIREYCADNEYDVTSSFPSFKRLESTLLTWIWLTSPRHQLYYCATPKCGSTTWKSFIMEDMRITWEVDTHL